VDPSNYKGISIHLSGVALLDQWRAMFTSIDIPNAKLHIEELLPNYTSMRVNAAPATSMWHHGVP
jgi:hypothetical protein